MNRCIWLWCKRKVLHRPLSWQRRWRGRRMSVGMLKNWHVWACRFATQSVTSWGTGGVFVWNVAFLVSIVGAVWWPKKSCKLSSKYEINNENNFAVVATLGNRSRKEVLSLTLKTDKFGKMFFRKNDTVILVLLQNRVNLVND